MHDSPIKTNYWLVDCRVVPSSFSETLNWPANDWTSGNIAICFKYRAIYRKIRYLFRRYDTIRYIDIENDISIFRYIESSLDWTSVNKPTAFWVIINITSESPTWEAGNRNTVRRTVPRYYFYRAMHFSVSAVLSTAEIFNGLLLWSIL